MRFRSRQHNTVLLVEDDEALAGEIVAAFDNEDVNIERVDDPDSLLLRPFGLSVIVMDRIYRERDTIHIIERMRATGDPAPIIIISGLTSVEERINGLRAGADDYLLKPFAMDELVARVLATRKRFEARRRNVLTVGPLVLDRVERTVRRDGRHIDLLPREFQLLDYLMQNAGAVVTRRMLLEHVWNIRGSTPTNVIDVHIGKLRKKIGGNDDEAVITNVRGIGFRLDPPSVYWSGQHIVGDSSAPSSRA